MSTKEPVNRAAYLPEKLARALIVKDAPYTSPPEGCVTIRTHAVAINPLDWLIQDKGDLMFTFLNYPFVLGTDVAGEVVEVGKNVTRFKKGDRALSYCRAVDKTVNDPAYGAFQNYTVVYENLTTHIPSFVPYENAAVVPLGLTTAAAGLFHDDQLALQFPTVPPNPTGKTLLIWGGSTSVGCNAIQLAVAAGYEVFTTSSPKNFDLLKKLGASKVFDYNSKAVVQEIISALKGKTLAGAMAIGPGAAEACMSILPSTSGHKFVSLVSFPLLKEAPQHFVFLRTAFHFVSWTVMYKLRGMFNGVKSNFLSVASISHSAAGKAVYVDFLAKALETGAFVPSPEPLVVGEGLEKVQEAFNLQKKGVSAKKVVVTL
jgi:NADPH:quinone reductase-like Zn-dependent oxidoreductase